MSAERYRYTTLLSEQADELVEVLTLAHRNMNRLGYPAARELCTAGSCYERGAA